MPRPMVVTIRDLGSNPPDHRGALRAISPEEIRSAMLFACFRDVTRGALEHYKGYGLAHGILVSRPGGRLALRV